MTLRLALHRFRRLGLLSTVKMSGYMNIQAATKSTIPYGVTHGIILRFIHRSLPMSLSSSPSTSHSTPDSPSKLTISQPTTHDTALKHCTLPSHPLTLPIPAMIQSTRNSHCKPTTPKKYTHDRYPIPCTHPSRHRCLCSGDGRSCCMILRRPRIGSSSQISTALWTVVHLS